MARGNLGCVVVAVDSSEESMRALRWALDHLHLRHAAAAAAAAGGGATAASDDDPGVLIILHVQSPLSIATSLNPGSIPFGGPSDVDVPAFSAAIEGHQRRITDAILKHALDICADRNVNVRTQVVVGDPRVKICEATVNLHANLLVMGCRSMGPIKRLKPSGLGSHEKEVKNQAESVEDMARSISRIKKMFFGSVSNYCINHVSCPVLVMKGT